MSGQGVGSVSWTYALVHVSVHFAQAFQQLFDFGGFGLCHLHGRRMVGTGFCACKSRECSEFGIHFSFEFSSLFPPSPDVPFARQLFLSPLHASFSSFPRLSLSYSLPEARTRTSLRASSHVRIRGALGMASTSKGLERAIETSLSFPMGRDPGSNPGSKGKLNRMHPGVGRYAWNPWEQETGLGTRKHTSVCRCVMDGLVGCVWKGVWK